MLVHPCPVRHDLRFNGAGPVRVRRFDGLDDKLAVLGMLQWGRTREGPEMGKAWQGPARRGCFNGAGPVRVRRCE